MVAALGFFALATILLVIARPSSEPTYKGKPLRYWLRGYRPGNFSWNESTLDTANEAVRNLGTNAIPTLLEMLQRTDSEWDVKTLKWSYKWRAWVLKSHIIEVHPIPYLPGYDSVEALLAFRTLGGDAASAVPDFVRLLEHNPPLRCSGSVSLILGDIGPSAEEAVPALLNQLQSTNWSARGNALFALGRIRTKATVVVPRITEALDDPNPYVCGSAASALEAYGREAKSSVPVLVRKLRDLGRTPKLRASRPVPYNDPREAVQRALIAIDPEVARTLP
jgi:hypothetical protein